MFSRLAPGRPLPLSTVSDFNFLRGVAAPRGSRARRRGSQAPLSTQPLEQRILLSGTELVSQSTGGDPGGGTTNDISDDGRYVAFVSAGDNLVVGDTNGRDDIFVHDRQTGETERVSVSSGGVEGNGHSFDVAISGDGRYVAFTSLASNLVAGDTNGATDVFVHDRQSGTTERVSQAWDGGEISTERLGLAISGNGQYVAFVSTATNVIEAGTNGQAHVYVHDRQAGTSELVSRSAAGGEGNGWSTDPAISGDGRYVAFGSEANNLIDGGSDTNGTSDVFLFDRQTETTRRISFGLAGAEANSGSYYPAISAAGSHVVFSSFASNLVSGDTNADADVFAYDVQAETLERVSLGASGAQGNNDVQIDGQSISGDGRYVAFVSNASNLVAGDTNGAVDVFVRDRVAATTFRVNVSDGGDQANGTSFAPSISSSGRYISFFSNATNLVSPAPPSESQVYVRDQFGDGKVGDIIWNDVNRNGIRDINRNGIPNNNERGMRIPGGITVNLYSSGDDLAIGGGDDYFVQTTQTDKWGLYEFSEVADGDYYIEVILPGAGYEFAPFMSGHWKFDSNVDPETGLSIVFPIRDGNHEFTIDVGMLEPGKIGDRVFVDDDQDGRFDLEQGERGLRIPGGMTVELYDAGEDFAIGGGDDFLVGTTQTDKWGVYEFTPVPASRYYVKFLLPQGYEFTQQNESVHWKRNSDADPTTGLTQVFNLVANKTDISWDAGLVPVAASTPPAFESRSASEPVEPVSSSFDRQSPIPEPEPEAEAVAVNGSPAASASWEPLRFDEDEDPEQVQQSLDELLSLSGE